MIILIALFSCSKDLDNNVRNSRGGVLIKDSSTVKDSEASKKQEDILIAKEESYNIDKKQEQETGRYTSKRLCRYK